MVSSRTASSYVDLSMTNVPALTHEPYMPPESALRYRVKFYYLVGQKQEEFWKDEGKFWSKDVESFVGKKDGVAEAVSQTVGTSDSAEDKVKKIYAYVGRLDNWSYLPPREAKEEKALGIKPNEGAGDVLRRHGGQHDDLTKLFVAMVRAAGIPASAMWISSRDRDFFDPALLSTSQLAAEVAIVQLGGKDVFLEPGTKYCPYGVMDWKYTNARGLRQNGKGAELAQSEVLSYNQAMTQRRASVHLTPEGRAEGTVRVGFFGLEAMQLRQAGGQTDDEGKKKLVEDKIKEWLPGDAEVSLMKGPAWENPEVPLVVELKVSAPLATSAGKRWAVPVHMFQGNEKPMFSASERVNSVYFDYSWREIDEVHITIPPGMEVESLPPSEKVVLDFALYRTDQKQEAPNTILATRDVALAGVLFPQPVYKEVKGFFDKVKAGDDQPLLAKAPVHAENK